MEFGGTIIEYNQNTIALLLASCAVIVPNWLEIIAFQSSLSRFLINLMLR
jgi:hypothetical protein